jgi:hypothetical protein
MVANEGPSPASEADHTAPDPVHDAPSGDPRRARWGRAFGAIVIAAAVACAVAFAMTAGVPDSVVVAHVAAAQDLAPTRPAPPEGGEVAGMRAPDPEAFRWSPSGSRVDVIGSHTVATTFYERGGRVLALSILSGGSVREPGHVVASPGGVPIHEVSLAGRTILSWRRDRHTIVLSSIAVPEAWLVALAHALITGTPSATGAGA